MKFHCPQEELSKALAVVSHAIAANNTLPVLDNILIRAEGTTVTFVATDLELAIEAVLSVPIEQEGAITVPAKLLSSYVNLLPGMVEVSVEVIEGDTLKLQAKGSHTKIKGLAARDYPTLPEFQGEHSFAITAMQFVRGVQRVLFSASQNSSRPILSGVYIDARESSVKLVATDSYRLSEAKIGLEVPTQGEVVCIVPAKTMQDVVRIFSKEGGTLDVQVSKNQVLFTNGTIRVISRLIEGRFPEYAAILPKKHESACELAASDMLMTTKRVNLFAKENNFNIRLETRVEQGDLSITTDSTQIGEEEATIAAVCSGNSTKIALNARYVIDALSNMGGEVIILEVDTSLAPAVFRVKDDTEYFHIIMPLKLNQ